MTGSTGGRESRVALAAIGWVVGTALQLQAERLLSVSAYVTVGVLGVAAWAVAVIPSPRGARVRVLLAWAALAYAACGLRATAYQADALAPALQGRDLQLTGRVAAMPQRNEAGLRFRFVVESARLDGTPVQVPPQILLGWYAGAASGRDAQADSPWQPADLRAGERWQLQARLKAPHGNRNPHGFDYELWLWEQGLQATGYVRGGPRDAPPRRLEATWRHPVERARQAVRDALLARVADRQQAGVLAALATGDQNAIDRGHRQTAPTLHFPLKRAEVRATFDNRSCFGGRSGCRSFDNQVLR